jgi:DNA-binding CsgD family transcriptional regulator
VVGCLLDDAPFRNRQNGTLMRVVETVRSVLDPDAVELEYYFLPEKQRYRCRFLGNQTSATRAVRSGRRPAAEPSALQAPFNAPDLLEGTLTLSRRTHRPWTGAEVRRFELLAPFLSLLLECAARGEIDACARRRLLTAADHGDAPVFLFGEAGTILYENAAAAALLAHAGPDGLMVFSDDGRDASLLPHLVRLASGDTTAFCRILALTNGRSLEARVAPRACGADGEDEFTVITLRELASPTLDDVRPRLVERGLSGREIEVVGAVLQGMRNAEIATQLFITEWTVKDHMKHIFHKLGVTSRAGLLKALYPGSRLSKAAEAVSRRSKNPVVTPRSSC